MDDARIRKALIIWKTTTPGLSGEEKLLIDWLADQAGRNNFAAARDHAIAMNPALLRVAIARARHAGILRRWP